MTQNYFVEKPELFVLGRSRPIASELSSWAESIGIDDLLEDFAEDGTPIDQNKLSELYGDFLVDDTDSSEAIIEFGGRSCYQSWKKGRDKGVYFDNILAQKHGSVTEHAIFNIGINGISRTLSHELIRHRHPGISELSQRFVDAEGLRFIIPPSMLQYCTDAEIEIFKRMCLSSKQDYITLQNSLRESLKDKVSGFKLQKMINEAARSVLPGCTETRLLWSVNARALRHILEVRGSCHADPEIRRFAIALYQKMSPYLPHILEDFRIDYDSIEGESVQVLKCEYSKI